MPRVLHVLAQRPSLTGSGITLDALVRHAHRNGWEQRVVVGVPAEDSTPRVADLDPCRISPVVFQTPGLPFPVPGMSDVMPYASTRWSSMSGEDISTYSRVWKKHLDRMIDEFAPDIVHSHHVWLVSSLIKGVAPDVPVVCHCHATGLRQMKLCPDLGAAVREDCRTIDRFVVLHNEHAEALSHVLDLSHDRIKVVGAGFSETLFNAHERASDAAGHCLYVGKLANAKGLPSLLEAWAALVASHPDAVLHIAGDGNGAEANALRQRMQQMGPSVQYHGRLTQEEVAELMRRCSVCVLPSFYEGLPLVLVEALACGCRLVATDLPGVRNTIAPNVGNAVEMIATPALTGVDTPDPTALPEFVERLIAALARALDAPLLEAGACDLSSFTWGAVYNRVETVWNELAD